MVRSALILTGILTLLPACLAADDNSTQAQKPSETAKATDGKQAHAKGEEAESLKKAVKSLSPEQKQRVAENIKTWKQLNPEQKEALRQREENLKKQVSEEIATIVKELPENEREAFSKRYLEERRKLQMALRQEMEAKRKAGIAEVLQKMKQEVPQTPVPTPDAPVNAPAASPNP